MVSDEWIADRIKILEGMNRLQDKKIFENDIIALRELARLRAQAEDVARLVEAANSPLWLVWSNEHVAWWGANRCGYFTSIESAGRYTLVDALDCCKTRSPRDDGIPDELPQPSPELIEILKSALTPFGKEKV